MKKEKTTFAVTKKDYGKNKAKKWPKEKKL
jgi:hypothetical protein